MFTLRIHSVDSSHPEDEGLAGVTSAHRTPPESTGDGDSTATSSSRSPNANPRIQILRGIVHLYRRPLPLSSSSSPFLSSSSLPHSSSDYLLPAGRGTLLFVLAVPSNLSPEDFLRFCGSYADRSGGIQIIRNDGMEDRYSVVVKLDDQNSADAFYLNLNGWRFSSAEGEICHILFLASVECTESTEIASTPPVGSTELPTCPLCIGLEFKTSLSCAKKTLNRSSIAFLLRREISQAQISRQNPYLETSISKFCDHPYSDFGKLTIKSTVLKRRTHRHQK